MIAGSHLTDSVDRALSPLGLTLADVMHDAALYDVTRALRQVQVALEQARAIARRGHTGTTVEQAQADADVIAGWPL